MQAPVITFVSDYGLADHFVGVCHGVMAGICPQARIIDVTHGVPRQDVRAGALTLAAALPYLPAGVHLAVVDPGVGTERRAVAVELADGRRAVAPDNGLLSLAASACGGFVAAADISASPCRLQPVSATFHGRDIFAPVAAHLACGATLDQVGAPCDPEGLVGLDLPEPAISAGEATAHAVYVDYFGNVALDVSGSELPRVGETVRVGLGGGRELTVAWVRTFAEVPAGQPLLYEDADRRLALAVSQGDAARELGLRVGDEVTLRFE